MSKLPSFVNGLRVVPYFHSEGVAWRIDARRGLRTDGVDIAPGGSWEDAITALNTKVPGRVTLKAVRALVGRHT